MRLYGNASRDYSTVGEPDGCEAVSINQRGGSALEAQVPQVRPPGKPSSAGSYGRGCAFPRMAEPSKPL